MNASASPIGLRQGPVLFGDCELRALQRELLVNDKPVAIGKRTFDLLLLLVGSGGELVTKDRILTQVWPRMIVEDNTIQVHISALRKAMGADRKFLKTVSGCGYRFVATVSVSNGSSSGSATATCATQATTPSNVPASTSEIIGRETDLATVIDLVSAHRLVTLVGAGGMGKTRIALEAARRLRDKFPDGVWLAALGSLRDTELVEPTVAAALRLESLHDTEFAQRVASGLADKEVLVVLDDCEHVIEAATRTAEALQLASPGVRVIATSREPLRADGERVFRVPGLGMAPQSSDDVAEVLASGAVQLFMARARAAEPRLTPDERVVITVAAICRRLDGIPLAIELAAARVAALGVEGLAARLDDRFALLSAGRRTALPRHQTLRATMDWSYDLLQPSERTTLRRLAIFAGVATLAAVGSVITGEGLSSTDVMKHIATLVAKSLVVAEVDGSITRYRLLETTRQYALEKLAGSGELEELARRHALYFRELLERAEAEADTRPAAEWQAQYGPSIDDVRAALAWAFSSSGDASLAVALTVAAIPLWFQCSLIDECRERVDRALSRDVPDSSRDLRAEMRLLAARSESLESTIGLVPETFASWTRTNQLAASLDNAEYQLRALWKLVEIRVNLGELAQALALGRQLGELAARRGDASDLLAAKRAVGHVLHLMGDHSQARQHLEGGLETIKPALQSHLNRYRIDQGIAAQCTVARILWLQGFTEGARSAADSAVRQARLVGHGDSLRFALSHAAYTLAILEGDPDAAQLNIARLRESFPRPVPRYWNALSRGFEAQVLIERGDVSSGLPLLRDVLDELGECGFQAVCRPFFGTLAVGLAAANQLDEALVSIDTAIAYAERSDERWSLPEWLRIKGQLLLLSDPWNSGAAEIILRRGLECARHQGAVAWELRCARSLARLLDRRGEANEAAA